MIEQLRDAARGQGWSVVRADDEALTVRLTHERRDVGLEVVVLVDARMQGVAGGFSRMSGRMGAVWVRYEARKAGTQDVHFHAGGPLDFHALNQLAARTWLWLSGVVEGGAADDEQTLEMTG